MAEILMQIRQAEQELKELLFLAVRVVACTFGQKLHGEFSLLVQLIESLRLYGLAFAAQARGGFQLEHGCVKIVSQAESFLGKRGRHGVSASRHSAFEFDRRFQSTLLPKQRTI
jgi:hypothetical protein